MLSYDQLGSNYTNVGLTFCDLKISEHILNQDTFTSDAKWHSMLYCCLKKYNFILSFNLSYSLGIPM